MNERQTSKLRMFLEVKKTAHMYESAWQSLPIFARHMTIVEQQIDIINGLNGNLQLNSKGATDHKDLQKLRMASLTQSVSAALEVFAHEKNFTELEAQATLTESTIMHAKEMDADDLCMHIYNLGKEHFEGLKEIGVTAEELDALLEAINTFSDLIGKPRNLINSRKTDRSKVDQAFSEAERVLQKVLDNMVYRLRVDHPNFYTAWQSARSVIISSPVHHTKTIDSVS